MIKYVLKSLGNLVNNYLKIDYSVQYMKFPNFTLKIHLSDLSAKNLQSVVLWIAYNI